MGESEPKNSAGWGDLPFDDLFPGTIILKAPESDLYNNGFCLIEKGKKKLIWGCDMSRIPSDGSVTSIAGYAFYRCKSLKQITIPQTVKSIGDRAFAECENLRDVWFEGTAGQWALIEIGLENEPLLRATIHFDKTEKKAKKAKRAKRAKSAHLFRNGKA